MQEEPTPEQPPSKSTDLVQVHELLDGMVLTLNLSLVALEEATHPVFDIEFFCQK